MEFLDMGMVDPVEGDYVAWIVGMPGPDVDYALCIGRNGNKAKLLFQVWQQDGDWHEAEVDVVSSNKYGCWKTERIHEIGKNLMDKKKELFG